MATRGGTGARVALLGDGPRAEALGDALGAVVPGIGDVHLLPPGPPSAADLSGLDGVLVVGSAPEHASAVLACVAARVPVLVEPPLAASPEEARAVLDAEQASGAALVRVGFARRHDPRFRDLRARLADGVVGGARLVHAVEVHDGSDEGGGEDGGEDAAALSDALDTVAWLLDDPVAAVRLERLGDLLVGTVATDGGRTLDLEVGAGADGAGEVRWEVVGTRGTLELVTDAAWLAEADRILLTAWVRSLAGATPIGAGAADGLAATLGVAAARASLASGQTVRLDSLRPRSWSGG